VASLRDRQTLPYAVVTLVFLMIYLSVLYLMFEERLAVYLKAPKPRISLKEKELSGTERLYIKNITIGKTSKDIAFDYEVSESTVRNTLARAYKKLGIEDKSELAALAERYELVD
jgi:DNA-binding NarL/FixJ family response regulator